MTKDGTIMEKDLPITVQHEQEISLSRYENENFTEETKLINIPINYTMKEAEQLIIESVLEECGGNRRKTAQALGISERSIRNKLHLYRTIQQKEAKMPSRNIFPFLPGIFAGFLSVPLPFKRVFVGTKIATYYCKRPHQRK